MHNPDITPAAMTTNNSDIGMALNPNIHSATVWDIYAIILINDPIIDI
jgi:hypothetical protein